MRRAVANGASIETASDKIGSRLRAARRARGLSIGQLAEATGLTRGFLSQVERDLASASLGTLVRICNALDIRVGELFDSVRADMVRADERPRISYAQGAVEELLLTPTTDGRLEVYDSTFEPGATGGDAYILQAEISFIHVLEGTLEFKVGDRTFLLSTSDSLTYSPRERHIWRNPSDTETARALWAVVRLR